MKDPSGQGLTRHRPPTLNRVQRGLAIVCLPIVVLDIGLDFLVPGSGLAAWGHYLPMLGLLAVAVRIRGKSRRQMLMTLAVWWMVIADIFLVLTGEIPLDRRCSEPLGVACFGLAYLHLIVAYRHRAIRGRHALLTAGVIIAVSLSAAGLAWPQVPSGQRPGAALFVLILSAMTWLAVCANGRPGAGSDTPAARPQNPYRSGRLTALSGILMFVCDLGVALRNYLPAGLGQLEPLLVIVVWSAYVPAWTLLVILMAESG